MHPKPARYTRPRRCAVAFSLCLAAAPAVVAQEAIEEQWQVTDEAKDPLHESPVQARASIYRGDHLLAVRCHRDGERQWESLVFSATWFLQPKANPVFSFQVDALAPLEVTFERLTAYHFKALSPPPELLVALTEGAELTISGPDYEGEARVVPLNGSREALDGAFSVCGYAMPTGG